MLKSHSFHSLIYAPIYSDKSFILVKVMVILEPDPWTTGCEVRIYPRLDQTIMHTHSHWRKMENKDETHSRT